MDVDIDQFASRTLLPFAGRSVRRPPMASFHKDHAVEVQFWAKDKIRKRRVNIMHTKKFVASFETR